MDGRPEALRVKAPNQRTGFQLLIMSILECNAFLRARRMVNADWQSEGQSTALSAWDA